MTERRVISNRCPASLTEPARPGIAQPSARLLILWTSILFMLASCVNTPVIVNLPPLRSDLGAMEQEISALVPDPMNYPDDPFILVTLKEALDGARERNGGIGACLVREATGEVIEASHNRQYEPDFRSDLHAEMDLLNRYEERVRRTRSRDPKNPTFRDPRDMRGIVLYTSVEPCPMCMGRIINAGVKKVLYGTVDAGGGMATRFESLPPFWKGMAEGLALGEARCSPHMVELAKRLFRPMAGRRSDGP